MQKILSVLFLIAASQTAFAHDYPVVKPLTSDMIDTTKNCAYAGQLYTQGSVLEQGGATYRCRDAHAESPIALEKNIQWVRQN